MLGLGLQMRADLRLEARLCLDHAQKQELRQLIELEARLRHDSFPNAAKGFEGMQIAHRILQEKQASGILIGGLAKAVWNQQRTKDELYAHKDVDVMVLDESAGITKFEGGIDWWLPHKAKIEIATEYGTGSSMEVTWYKNGNGINLSFGPTLTQNLSPGLYIPDRNWVADMQEAEVYAHVDKRVKVDSEVEEKFRAIIEKGLKTRLPKYIRESFKEHMLDPHYSTTHSYRTLYVDSFDLDKIRAINRYEGDVGNVEEISEKK